MSPSSEWIRKINNFFNVDQEKWNVIEEELVSLSVKQRTSWLGLDAGCGKGSHLGKTYREKTVGVDSGDRIAQNKDIDRKVICNLEALPFKGASFDIITSRFVVEHLRRPRVAFREFSRVLRPGGALVIWTTNLMNYMMVISLITPNSFHSLLKTKLLRACGDTCPTFYRANTPWKLVKLLRHSGFSKKELIMKGASYKYLRFSKALYVLGLLMNELTKCAPLGYFRLYLVSRFVKE